MNTFGLRPEFQIPIAVHDETALRALGWLRTIRYAANGTIAAAGIKPLSTVFPRFAGGAALISAGADISVMRYGELVDEEQLWISPKVADHRDVFIAWHPKHAIPSGFDVDHALSKALAIHLGYGYVRLTLVSISANRSAGSSGEKLGLRSGPPLAQLRLLPLEPVVYADPSDLTKLFNVSHGNTILAGVADFQRRNPFIFR